MKQISATFILFTIFLNSFSQIFAGYHLSEYTDINPDTLISGICHSSSPEESYFVDNKFEIKSYCSSSPSHLYQYTSVTSLNPNTYIRLGRIDSVYNNYQSSWWIAKVAKPLYYGDSINSANAEWNNTILYLVKVNSATGTTQSVTDWVDTNDRYIGVMYQTNTDTIYGWIRVSWSNGSVIKDYSFGQSSNLIIKKIEPDNVNIYPNPVCDILTIETEYLNKEIDLQITDMHGKELKNEKIINKKTTIDISGLKEGFYFLIFDRTKKMTIKKIIVQRN